MFTAGSSALVINKNYVKVLTSKPKTNLLITKNGSNYKDNNLDELIYKSNLILKADVTKTEVKAFIEYINGKAHRTINKKIITIRPVAIYKMDKKSSNIKLGSLINILSDCCSYNNLQEIIPIKVNNQYVFFLEPVENDGLIQYSRYGKFNIYKPTWSSILFQNNFYTFSNYHMEFTALDDTQAIEKKNSPYGDVVFKSQNIEKTLINLIRSQIPFQIVQSNVKEGLGYLSSKKIDSISIGDDKYLTDASKNKILDYLNNIHPIPINMPLVPAGAIPSTAIIEFKDDNIIKTEIINLYNCEYMVDTAYDRYNNLVYEKCFFSKNNMGYGLQDLCNDINSSKKYSLTLDVKNINNESIESITVSNFIQREKRFIDKQGIENSLNILKSINATQTLETIKNSSIMKMCIVYKNTTNNIHNENFYFTENLMLYKAYDSSGNLMSTGFYKIDKDILKDIENLLILK